MPHHIELFKGNCPLCWHVENMLILGKCVECKLEIHDLNRDYNRLREKIREYKIRSVPTIVIDGRIKIEGLPEFTFICSEELYNELAKRYPL